MLTAGWPMARTCSTRSEMRAAPSSSEYSVCVCRWTNEPGSVSACVTAASLLLCSFVFAPRRTCVRYHSAHGGRTATGSPHAPERCHAFDVIRLRKHIDDGEMLDCVRSRRGE